jgi:hypothetical protein
LNRGRKDGVIVVRALHFINSYAEPFVVLRKTLAFPNVCFDKDSLKVKELKLVGDEAGLSIDAL